MKIEISEEEITIIYSLFQKYLHIGSLDYQKGQRAKEEEIYQFLKMHNHDFIIDCKHGRPVWSCRECLK